MKANGTGRKAAGARGAHVRRLGVAAGLLIAAGLLAPGSSRADEGPPQGTPVSGIATVQRMQIPLPTGQWLWAGRAFTQLAELEGVAYGTIESDVLFHVEDGAVASFMMVYRNAIPVENGWGGTEDCSKDGLIPPSDYFMSESHIFCSFIERVRTASGAATGADGAWKAALLYAETQHIKVPSDWFMVGYRKADRRDMLDVRYHFAVTSLIGGGLAGGAATPAQTSELEQWRDLMRGPLRWGFDNALPAAFNAPMPGTDEAAAPSPEVALKLGLLDGLRDKDVVSDIDYRRQRAAILATQVKLAEKKVSNEELTLWKTIADQTSAGAANLVIDYGVLQNPISAVGLFSVQRLFDMFQYSSHEWAWNTWGPRGLSEPPAIELPGASPAQPGAAAGQTAAHPSNGATVLQTIN
jgi:hypothetical protein